MNLKQWMSDHSNEWYVNRTEEAAIEKMIGLLRAGDRIHATQPTKGPQRWHLNERETRTPATLLGAAIYLVKVGRARRDGEQYIVIA